MKLTSTIRRKFRIRNKLKKVSNKDRLRLSISRSTKNISAQIIDDIKQVTIISASSNEKDLKSLKKNKSEISSLVAEKLTKKEIDKKITKIYFDRGVYKYHGRVKIFADTLRKKWNEILIMEKNNEYIEKLVH